MQFLRTFTLHFLAVCYHSHLKNLYFLYSGTQLATSKLNSHFFFLLPMASLWGGGKIKKKKCDMVRNSLQEREKKKTIIHLVGLELASVFFFNYNYFIFYIF